MENGHQPAPRARQPARYLDPEVAAMLAAARRQLGWSYRQAGRKSGVAYGYLCLLEQGKRAPSVVVARILAAAYRLGEDDARRLEACAVTGAGRDWPAR